jgi:hypothetical protein
MKQAATIYDGALPAATRALLEAATADCEEAAAKQTIQATCEPAAAVSPGGQQGGKRPPWPGDSHPLAVAPAWDLVEVTHRRPRWLSGGSHIGTTPQRQARTRRR